jgi:hypothetical protein
MAQRGEEVQQQRERKEKRIYRAQEVWKQNFDLYAGDGVVEGIEGLTRVVTSAGSHFREKEIEEAYEAMGKPDEVKWEDIKPLTIKEPANSAGWRQLSKHDASTMRHMKEPEDLFQQLFYAYQFFLNSSGVAGNRVDVAYLQYLLSSRGDEMSGDLFEEFLKAVDHPVKGSFDLALFMQVYLKYAMKAGIYSDEGAEKAQRTIELTQETYSLKAKKNLKKTNTADGDNDSNESEEPSSRAVKQRPSLFKLSGRLSIASQRIAGAHGVHPIDENEEVGTPEKVSTPKKASPFQPKPKK